SYRPNHDVACCAGQVNRIMPNFAARMWLRAEPDTIVAAMYGPSRITARLGNPPRKVTITQQTDYPFSERIDFTIHTAKPIRFGLTLRIPAWCRKACLLINDKPSRPKRLTPATFVKIRRLFRDQDRITLILPMQIKLTRWPKAGLGIERGPLVYALPIEEDRQIDKRTSPSNKKFPALNLYPASPWNYALALDAKSLKTNVQLIQRPVGSLNPWSLETAPVQLLVPARRVRNWKIVRPKVIESFRDGRVRKIKGR
ncbi:unnamed protein product, partial [marine sediment metagenome]